MRSYYRDDPRWITVRYGTTCRKCGGSIRKGSEAFYYPRGKALYCTGQECGGVASARFEAEAADEYAMSQQGGCTRGCW